VAGLVLDLAMSDIFRRRLGALVIQLPSGSIPTISNGHVGHHPDELLAIALRHPILRLNAFTPRDPRLEFRDPGEIFGTRRRVRDLSAIGVNSRSAGDITARPFA